MAVAHQKLEVTLAVTYLVGLLPCLHVTDRLLVVKVM